MIVSIPHHADESVNEHAAGGIGVHSNFMVCNVEVPTGIKVPSNKKGIVLQNPFTAVFLNDGGSIEKVVDQGGALVGDAAKLENKEEEPKRAWIGDMGVFLQKECIFKFH